MRLRAVAAVAVLLLAAACGSDSPTEEPATDEPTSASPSASEPAAEELVAAPGAIGPALAGMTVEEANATGLFEPREEVADDPCKDENPPIQWKAPNTETLTVRVKGDTISSLGVRDGVETAKGIGVGSTYGDVKAAYPDAKAEPSQALGSTVYRQDGDKWLGMGFDEDPDNVEDASKLLYMEVSVGEKPATFLSGCG
ncbi:MAG: hypothetical protein ACR2FE_11065 [Aeromicrobium sp.]